jgi:hypothetical protein
MKRQRIQIATPLKVEVSWYDHVTEYEKRGPYEGEVIGWRTSQVIVRVKEYAVLRFWKATGLEVGNGDAQRRGFQINLDALKESAKPPQGLKVELEEAPAPVTLKSQEGGPPYG